MIWRFRFRKARTRARDKAQDRGDWAPIPNEVRRATQQEFHAWAAMVRTSVEAIQALAEEIKDRDRALEDLLQSPKPDPAAIGALVLEIQARRTEMQRIVEALPALDDMGEADEACRPGAVLPR